MSHDSVVLLCAVSCVTLITGVEMGLLLERSLVVADAPPVFSVPHAATTVPSLGSQFE